MTAVPRPPAHAVGGGAPAAPDPDDPAGSGPVYTAQVFFLGALTLPVAVALLSGLERDDTLFSLGLVVGALSAVLTGVITRHGSRSRWTWAVAALDAVACMLLAASTPGAGFSILVVLPVAWVATFHGGRATIVAVVAATTGIGVAQLGSALANDVPLARGYTATVCAALLVSFVAVGVRLRHRRTSAHRTLLQQQSRLLDRALERTRVQEQVLAEVLDSVEFAVVTLGPEGEVELSNQAARALVGRLRLPGPAALVDGPVYAEDRESPVGPEDLPVARAKAGQTVDHEVVWLGHPGDPRVAASASIRRLGHDGDSRLVLILRDVTDEIEDLEARDEMVASISHELRTPLTSVLGYLEMALDDESVPAPTRRMLDVAMSNTERVLTISNDVLAARTHAPRGGLELDLAPCRPDDIARQAVEAMRPIALARYISLVPGPVADVTVVADALRLRQVVDNLLSNAIKYNVFGGRVDVVVRALDDGVELVVADTGRGMSEDDAAGLFTRFYRTESARSSTVQGTGLGLSITRDIVELHGGTIGVESTPDVGTTITVRLPRDPATATRTAPDQENP